MQIQLKCQEEKELLEMKSIEEKFGTELEIQVRQEMGLPAKKIPVPDLQELIPGMFGNTGSSYVTPSSLIEIKTEKFNHDAYTDPSTPTKHGEKRKDMEHLTPPPSKWFAMKQDFQQTFTPSKQTGRSSCLQLFSPPSKSSAQSAKEENTLEIKSSQYMKSISCVKHDLMVAAHQFLFEKTSKDYVNKIWVVIEKNILIEKQAIVASAETQSHSLKSCLSISQNLPQVMDHHTSFTACWHVSVQ